MTAPSPKFAAETEVHSRNAEVPIASVGDEKETDVSPEFLNASSPTDSSDAGNVISRRAVQP